MRDVIRQQFGAAIDALENAVHACPGDAWASGERGHQPWYLTFHTLFWLDLYLSENAETYVPPHPFTRSEMQQGGFPDQQYSREQLLGWLNQCRANLLARLETISTEEGANRTCHLHWGTMAAGELLLYGLRHVQHHVGQLNLIIRQAGGEPGAWVMRTDGL